SQPLNSSKMPRAPDCRQVRSAFGAESRGTARRLHFLPRERGELAAVLGERARDRVAAVENRGATVLFDLLQVASNDDAAQHPGLPVHLEIALDVDQSAIDEARVDGEVAVHIEQ